jgi:thymidylate kinase
MGPDGSGKSSVASDLRRWLGWKLDVHAVYFGSGDGPSSLLRWPLKAALRLRGARRPAAGTGAPQRVSAGRCAWALLLAREKRSKMRACVKARNRGMLVVCDRYPQAQFSGFNDGPLLASWLASGAGWQRALARWEGGVYRRLALEAPDLVIKLDVTPEAGLARSPDSAPGEVEQKRQAVRALDYGPRSRVVAIDAMRPFDAVLREARRAVWEAL